MNLPGAGTGTPSALPTDCSVIVPVYNGAATLAGCLAALQAPGPMRVEIIVVDDASTDGSLEIAARGGATVFRNERNLGPSASRNRGGAAARGGLLLFVDADVVLRPGTLQEVHDRLRAAPELAGVCGNLDWESGHRGWVSRYKSLFVHYTLHDLPRQSPLFYTAISAIRREVFIATGGFDTDTRICEDEEYGFRLRQARHLIQFDNDVLGRHYKPYGLGEMIRADFSRCLVYVVQIFRRFSLRGLAAQFRARSFSHSKPAFTIGSLSAIPAVGLLLLLLLRPEPATAALALAGLAVNLLLTRDFYRFAARRIGWLATMRLVPIVWVDQCTYAVGMAAGAIRFLLTLRAQAGTRC